MELLSKNINQVLVLGFVMETFTFSMSVHIANSHYIVIRWEQQNNDPQISMA
jgi:hypothetical protein